ncbi:MAG: dockerin type I domain-containing protein [Porcipelethomonas sp.]
MKKSAIIAFAAAASLLGSLNVYADSPDVLIQAENCFVSENDEAQVRISVKNNTGIAAFAVELCYDPEVLVFEDAESTNKTKSGSFGCNGEYMQDSVKVVWSSSSEMYGNGDIAVLKFRTKGNSADTVTPVRIGYCELADSKPQGVGFETMDGEIKIAGEINEGDADGNGKIEVCDAVTINKYLLDSVSYPLKSITAEANADMDKNGKVELADTGILINRLCSVQGG